MSLQYLSLVSLKLEQFLGLLFVCFGLSWQLIFLKCLGSSFIESTSFGVCLMSPHEGFVLYRFGQRISIAELMLCSSLCHSRRHMTLLCPILVMLTLVRWLTCWYIWLLPWPMRPFSRSRRGSIWCPVLEDVEMQLGESQTLTQPASVAASQLSLPAALY